MVEIMTERLETCKLFETLPATKLKPGESVKIVDFDASSDRLIVEKDNK